MAHEHAEIIFWPSYVLVHIIIVMLIFDICSPLQFLIGLAVTILTDIVHFGLYYAVGEIQYKGSATDLFRFSGGMAILSLLLKPVSCLSTRCTVSGVANTTSTSVSGWPKAQGWQNNGWLVNFGPVLVQSAFWHMWKFFCQVKMAALFALVCLRHYWAYCRHYNSYVTDCGAQAEYFIQNGLQNELKEERVIEF